MQADWLTLQRLGCLGLILLLVCEVRLREVPREQRR